MKRFLSFFIAAVTAMLSVTTWAAEVSKEEAATLANSFLAAKQTNSARKAPSATQLASATTANVKFVDLKESLDVDQYYIIQEEDEDGGWVMMAADDAVQPILAFGETGYFDADPSHMPDNLKWWLGMYNNQIKRAKELKLSASAEVQEEWAALRSGARKAKAATVVVGPLLTTKWNQGAPFNNLCPTYSGSNRSATGCVATAMAQVMNYWEWPEKGQGSRNGINFANTTYDWANMKDNYNGSYTNAQATAVATLMYHCGQSVDMSYGASSGAYTIPYPSTSTTYACAQNALWRYFAYNADSIKGYYRDGGNGGYASWTDAKWIAMLKEELDKRHPIMYAGSGTGGGHSFVCDGYRDDNYFHFNWGWGGSYDNYFTVNNLAPGGGGIGSNDDNTFNSQQDVIIGIVPNVSQKYTVTFSAGDHGTCTAAPFTQATIGQSCTLPDVTPDDKYLFLGWSTVEGSRTPDAGKAGDSYTPMRNLTLYAVVVQDGYVLHFLSRSLQYTDGTNVEWNWHGDCEVDSIIEESTGAGIVLPTATSDGGWTFQQWVYISGGSIYVAGYPGDRVYPGGNMYLYGYWTEDAKMFLSYAQLKGVTKVSGPDAGWIPQADGFTATFTATEGYKALTAANTTVDVQIGGESLAGCTSFANGVLTITLLPEQMIDDIDIFIEASEDFDACDDYSYPYTQAASQNNAGAGNNKNLGGYIWNVTAAGNTTTSWQSSACRFGANGTKCTSVTYVTNSANDCLIDNIVINAWAGRSGTIEAFINNTSLGTKTLTTTTADYTFANTNKLQGQVKFVVTNTSGNQGNQRYYLFVKSININMVKSLNGPIKVSGVDFLQGLYYDYYGGEGDPWYIWQLGLGSGTDGVDYPWINAIIEAPVATSLNGTHQTLALYGDITSATDTTEAFNDSYQLTLTYQRTSGYYSYYHAYIRWTDDITGQEYYIDDDVEALLINYDQYEESGDITGSIVNPTGDSDPRYYKVNYYQQNATDDGYTLKESITGQGASGATVIAPVNSYYGFLTPAEQTATLANTNTATNPKVIDYYYDRRSFPVNFIVTGLTVQSDVVRYKATPEYRGETPERTATDLFEFEFSGWSPLIAPISQATTYTAQFIAHPYFTVTFNMNGHGTAPENQRLAEGSKIVKPADPTADGFVFGGWYKELACTNAWDFNNDVVTANTTLFAKWSVQTRILTWDAAGGVLSGTYTSGAVEVGAPITAPTATRTGYTFTGWNPTVPATMPDNDLTIVAQWLIKTYTGLTFTSEDASKGTVSVNPEKDSYNYNETIAISAQAAEGYEFDQWSDGSHEADRTITVGDATTSLVASFKPKTNIGYTVRFWKQNILDDLYTEQLPAEYPTGTTGTLTNAAAVAKTYDGFQRLQFDEKVIAGDGSTVVDIYYNRLTYAIQFIVEGVVKQSEVLRFDAMPEYKGETPVKAADAQYTYTFNGWDPAIEKVSKAQDYTAKFSTQLNQYTVSFNANGHGTAPVPQSVGYGQLASAPAAPSETGYTFGGWYKEAACTNAWDFANDAIEGNVELFAKWTVNTHRLNWDANGGELSGSYTSGNAIAFGTAIVRPTASRTGYTFAGWSDGSALVTPPATMPDNDLDFIAQWTANTNTAYKVVHYQQNILDDNYTEFETQNLTGTTGANVTPAVKDYTGFTAPATQTAAILADGSLVIEYRYDRNSYNLSWDVNEGDPLTGNYTSGLVKFGATIVAPNTPTRTGWTFTGWAPAAPETMPAESLTLVATWTESGNTAYEVRHFKQQLDGSYPAVADEIDALTGKTGANVTPAVKNYPGFTAPATQTATILADGSLVIEYRYARNTHSLSWDANGGELSGSYTEGNAIFFGAAISAPTASRTGYTFNGWSATVPATMPDNDLAFVAQWSANTNTAYKVEHYFENIEDDNFTLVETENLKGTTGAEVSPAVKNEVGFTAPALQTANILADGSLVITYQYTRNKYTLAWNVNGGDALNEPYSKGELKFGASIQAPTDPVWKGHTFHGWNPAAPATMPANDVTCVAQWTTDTYNNISFNSSDETMGSVSASPDKDSYSYGEEVTVTATANEGYSFDGWSNGETSEQITVVVDENTGAIVANFKPNTDTKYIVRHLKEALTGEFVQDGADEELYGTTGADVTPEPRTYTGFITPSAQTKKIAADGSLVIEYRYERNTYSLTWNANGGEFTNSGYTEGQVKYEAEIIPAQVARKGYEFLGWGAEVPSKMPAGSLAFTAQWKAEEYNNISFNSSDETMGTVSASPDKDSYSYGETVTVTATANEGYSFDGWSNGETSEQITVVIDENTGAITANFKPNTDTKFIIRYLIENLAGDAYEQYGTEEEAHGTTGASVSPEPIAIPGFEVPEVQTKTIAADGSTVFEYRYARKSFTLKWDANGGLIDGAAVKEELVRFEAPLNEPVPSFEGHNFLGWDALVPATMPAEDLTLTAQWDVKTFTITFLNEDGTQLDQVVVEYGETPEYTGETPTKEEDDQYTYEFAGWDTEIVAATADATYTAVFTATEKQDPHGIEIVIDGKTIWSNTKIRIYDFNGRDVTELNGNLGNGMYIVVGGGEAVKVAIQ